MRARVRVRVRVRVRLRVGLAAHARAAWWLTQQPAQKSMLETVASAVKACWG